jgi:hypothetical protein
VRHGRGLVGGGLFQVEVFFFFFRVVFCMELDD